MTISTEVQKSGPYTGTGATTVFAYGFRILEEAGLEVILTSALGVEVVQTLTTHYTVSGVGVGAGGNVTMIVPPATTETLTIRRSQPITQLTDYITSGAFDLETVEKDLDRSAMRDQVLDEKMDRTIRLPSSDAVLPGDLPVAANRINKLLGFDGTGAVSVAFATAITLAPSDQPVFSSRSTVAATSIDAAIDHFYTAGRAAAGDGGHSLFKDNSAVEPTYGGVQSSDGQWWKEVPHGNMVLADAFADIQEAIDFQNNEGGGIVLLTAGKTYSLATGTTQGFHIKLGVSVFAFGAVMSGDSGTGAVVKIGGSTSAFEGGLYGGTILQGATVPVGLLLGGNCRAATVEGTVVDGDFSDAQVKLSSENSGEICYFNNIRGVYTRQAGTTGACCKLVGRTAATQGYVNRNTIQMNSNDGDVGLDTQENASSNFFQFSNQNANYGIKVGNGSGDCNFNQFLFPFLESINTMQLTIASNAVEPVFLGGNISETSTATVDGGVGRVVYGSQSDLNMYPGAAKTWDGRLTLAAGMRQRIGYYSMAANRFAEIKSYGGIDAVTDLAAGVKFTIERAAESAIIANDISFTANNTISSVGGDFGPVAVGESIEVVTVSGANDGTYTVATASSTVITTTETTITTENAATAGTVAISHTAAALIGIDIAFVAGGATPTTVSATDIRFTAGGATEVDLSKTDISFTAPDLVNSVAGDFTNLLAGETITFASTSGLNDGAYVIATWIDANNIELVEQTIQTESAVAAGTVTFKNKDAIHSASGGFGGILTTESIMVDGKTSSTNKGTYVVDTATANTIVIDETTLTTQTAAAAGRVTLSNKNKITKSGGGGGNLELGDKIVVTTESGTNDGTYTVLLRNGTEVMVDQSTLTAEIAATVGTAVIGYAVAEWTDAGKVNQRSPRPVVRINAAAKTERRDVYLDNTGNTSLDIDYQITINNAGG